MTRALLTLLTLLALALPAASALAAKPAPWPLAHTPLVLAPDACAADRSCTDWIARRDAVVAAETPQQRAARERERLRATAAPRDRRQLARLLRENFATPGDAWPASWRARMARVTDPARIRAAARRQLDARGWPADDFGSLMALSVVASWEYVNERRLPRASADAFRAGLRDALARSPKTARLTRGERYYGGWLMATFPVFVARLTAAMPARGQREIREVSVAQLARLMQETFGFDLLALEPVASGFETL